MENQDREIRQIMAKELSGSHHDIEHIERVLNLCMRLAKHESHVDLDVLRTATLLHDIARVKEFEDRTGTVEHASLGAEMAEQLLTRLGYPKEKIAQVGHCIMVHRYRRNREPQTIEAKILFDADKIDALGAVGVARSFMMAGHFNQRIYSDISVADHVRDNVFGGKSGGGLKDASKHTPNLEFEVKFKHLPERMYTKSGRELAAQRLQYMESFFDRLLMEIRGEL